MKISITIITKYEGNIGSILLIILVGSMVVCIQQRCYT